MINFKKINLLLIVVLFSVSPQMLFGMKKVEVELAESLCKEEDAKQEDKIKAKKFDELIEEGKIDRNIALGMIKTEDEAVDKEYVGGSIYEKAFRIKKVPDPKKILFKEFFRAAVCDFGIDYLKKFDKFIDEKKIDVNATDKLGRTALESICYGFMVYRNSEDLENSLEKVKYLVSKGARITETGIYILNGRHVDGDLGFKSRLREVLKSLFEENQRLFNDFVEAVRHGTLDDVKNFEKLIQEKKIDINAGFKFGKTVLDFLCCDRYVFQERDCDKIEFLVKNGAFVKEKDIKGYFGPESKREKILKLLQETLNNQIIEENRKIIGKKEKEARKEAKRELLCEFDEAVDSYSVKKLKKFVEKNKVDVNDVYTFGFSPIRYLCFISQKDSNYEPIEYLVKNCNADVNITCRKIGSSRYSALYWSCVGKNEKTTKLLLKKDALFLNTDSNGPDIEEAVAFRDKMWEEMKMGPVKKEDGQTSNLDVLF